MEFAVKETKVHGKPDFPYMVYNVKMPKLFTYFPMHWHEEFEFIYVMEGHLDVIVDANRFVCSSGDIVIIPPGHIHDMEQHASEECHYCNIMFLFTLLESDEKSSIFKKYFEPFCKNDLKEYFIPTGTKLNSILAPLAKELFETRHEKYSTDELRVKGYLFTMLFNILPLIKENELVSETRASWIAKIKPILSYVSKNFVEEMTVEQAAEMCALSKSHFMKIFKIVTGYSFLDYVKKCRLENAFYLLTETDENISHIGEKTGFPNFSYFIRSFKSAYGMSPLQYRKKFLENKKNPL